MKKTHKQALVRLCRQKCEVDDKLGHYSDHEGTTGGENEGPTAYLFRTFTLEQYMAHIKAANEHHRQAIRIQNSLLKLKIELSKS